MRICHVIESAANGSAGVVLTLAAEGALAGHEVTVVYSPIRADARFLTQAEALRDVRLVPLAMRRKPHPADLHAAAHLRALLRRDRFDIVHSHSSKAGALARLAGIGCGRVQVYTPHGFVTLGRAAGPGGPYGLIERILSRYCDAVVAVSVQEGEHGRALGIPANKIHVIPNGIDAALIADDPHVRPVDAPFTVGFVGRLSDQKHPLLAIEAFETLLKRYPASRMVMIGDEALQAAMAARVSTPALADRVRLVGGQAALPFYPQFDVLLCSSRYEGMPLTFLEALANGVPIVSTPVGGVDELIDEGETGLIHAATPAALGEGLAAMAALDPAGRARMRANAFAKARAFTTQIMVERTMRLYEDHLSRR